jgi:biopolymer transport protein ExbB
LRPYEQQLSILRALVACSPLLGLLGTVKGMITTFIALGGRGVASMDMLSVGISEALITTQVGLVVAIPGLVGSHASARLIFYLRNALDRLCIHRAMEHTGVTRAQTREAPTCGR